MASEISLHLPWPPAALGPNARVHWAQRARYAKKVRRDTCMVTRSAMTAAGVLQYQWKAKPVQVDLTFVSKGRKMDIDNAIARNKALLDGIADALGVNDSRFQLTAKYGSADRVGVHVRVST